MGGFEGLFGGFQDCLSSCNVPLLSRNEVVPIAILTLIFGGCKHKHGPKDMCN